MSKFFKALEQAERERALRQQGDAEDTPPPQHSGSPEVAAAEESRGASLRDVEVASPAASASTTAAEAPARESVALPSLAPTGRGTAVEPPVGRPSQRPAAPVVALPQAEEDVADVEAHLVSLHAPSSFAAEQYRTLRHIVESDPSLQVLAVTSPALGDGKTTTAVNFAGVLAQAPGARVLLIDADLRAPQVTRYLGMPLAEGQKGLVDLLTDARLGFESAVVTRYPYNLAVMPSGSRPSNPYEVLKSSRLEWVLKEARQRYHFVVVDTPPAVPLPDSRLLGNFVDGYVVIVAANRTPRGLLRETLETLNASKIIGVVFNRGEGPATSYESYYAAGNGRRHGRFRGAMTRLKLPILGANGLVRRRS